MKKSIPLLAALLVGGTVATAQQSTYSATVDFPFVSQYVFRGQKIAKDSFQPSVEVTSGDFYGGLWMNFPLSTPSRAQDIGGTAKKEIDLYAGYNLKISETLKADLGLTYYYYPMARKAEADKQTVEWSVGLNWTAGGFTPSVYMYYDMNLKVWTVQGSVGYSVPLANMGTSFDINATFGRVDPDTGSGFTYFTIGGNVPFKLSETAKLNIGVAYSVNSAVGGTDPELWFTGGLTVGF